LSDGKIDESEAEDILNELASDGEVTAEEVQDLAETLSEDGKLTDSEKELIADALVESIAPGESLTKEQIQEAGIEYKDLPADTPVEVRQDENGNEVVITAEVAASLVLLENPSELLSTALSDPGAALEALGNIGADMSAEEREEATEMVVATVVAAGAAINAAAVAAGGATGGGTGGGGSSGGSSSGANSPGSRGGRKW
jgi:polyhydroxyalkanoate synthesis regulator phasin